MKIFEEILLQNDKLVQVLKVLQEYAKAIADFKNYYLGAGCINQTILNYYHRFDLNYGIKDYNIVYYDPDESYEVGDVIIKGLSEKLKDIDVDVDIKNQVRVHI